jgi:hypothetical protein
MSIAPTAPITPPAQAQAPAAAKSDDGWDFSFKNLLDIINPLQHIPVISTIYQNLTGDRPALPEKLAGDTLYGGVVGFLSSIADTAYEALTGKDFGDSVLAFFTGGDKSTASVAAKKSVSSAGIAALNAPVTPAANNEVAARASLAYGKSIDMTNRLANAY